MMASSSSEEQQPELQLQQQQQQQAPAVKEKECVHKTKAVQFLGRTTPIVLQNDNGPCPLLAICNVLLLRNNLNLSPDIAEVSQEKLLSLVAERLIDSNSNIDNKDAGYVENQQQNISDAIDLLPRLTTGIDVNIKFKRIDDFEFTPECAIFDLLDIPLYHGWIVDPQDDATANAIGSKSYNALTSELVALETQNMEGKRISNHEEDSIDFAAATTATLGVPSPSLSKTRSFSDSPRAVSDSPRAVSDSPRAVLDSPRAVFDHLTVRKGDLEEEAELLRVMQLSAAESPTEEGSSKVGNADGVFTTGNSDDSKKVMPVDSGNKFPIESQTFHQPETSVPGDCNASSSDNNDLTFKTIIEEAAIPSLKVEELNHLADSDVPIICNDILEKSNVETQQQTESSVPFSPGKDTNLVDSNHKEISQGTDKVSESIIAPDANEPAGHQNGCVTTELSCLPAPNADSSSSNGRMQEVGAPEALTSNVDGGEPMYEGEECIMESGTKNNENREPMYEGEVILAEQADKSILDASNLKSKDEITPQQGELIRNFLKNNASQLTFYGLFSLQDGLKERELCVFFRNNHFSTMFKYEGELYLLATDQGYINEPDLVWEKLNEVNGDTIFMTGNFKEFKVESQVTETWDENNVMASTADYLASIDSASQAGLDINSDLQLAIALQQQEFEQQPQRQNMQQQQQQPSVSGGSRMVTGPQVPRTANRNPTPSVSKPEPKSKDKCTVM